MFSLLKTKSKPRAIAIAPCDNKFQIFCDSLFRLQGQANRLRKVLRARRFDPFDTSM